MYQGDNDRDTLDEDGVYIPTNIWGWNGLAREIRLKRKEAKETKQRSPARILERMINVCELRFPEGNQ